MSFQYGVTLFDGLYLALADDLAIDLVVADERLLRSPAGRLPFVYSLDGFAVDGGG